MRYSSFLTAFILVLIESCALQAGKQEESLESLGPEITDEDRDTCSIMRFKEIGVHRSQLTPDYRDWISKRKLTWPASLECCILHNYELLPMVTASTRQKYSKLPTAGAWVNANDIIKAGNWSWPSGDPVSTELWDEVPKIVEGDNLETHRHCARLRTEHRKPGALSELSCRTELNFICREEALIAPIKPTLNLLQSGNPRRALCVTCLFQVACRDILISPNCETFLKHGAKNRLPNSENLTCSHSSFTQLKKRNEFLSKTKLPWVAAKLCCEFWGLVLLPSIVYEDRRLYPGNMEYAWVGGKDLSKKEVTWEWLAGSRVDPRLWGDESRPGLSKPEKCALLHSTDGEVALMEYNCKVNYHFICQGKSERVKVAEVIPLDMEFPPTEAGAESHLDGSEVTFTDGAVIKMPETNVSEDIVLKGQQVVPHKPTDVRGLDLEPEVKRVAEDLQRRGLNGTTAAKTLSGLWNGTNSFAKASLVVTPSKVLLYPPSGGINESDVTRSDTKKKKHNKGHPGKVGRTKTHVKHPKNGKTKVLVVSPKKLAHMPNITVVTTKGGDLPQVQVHQSKPAQVPGDSIHVNKLAKPQATSLLTEDTDPEYVTRKLVRLNQAKHLDRLKSRLDSELLSSVMDRMQKPGSPNMSRMRILTAELADKFIADTETYPSAKFLLARNTTNNSSQNGDGYRKTQPVKNQPWPTTPFVGFRNRGFSIRPFTESVAKEYVEKHSVNKAGRRRKTGAKHGYSVMGRKTTSTTRPLRTQPSTPRPKSTSTTEAVVKPTTVFTTPVSTTSTPLASERSVTTSLQQETMSALAFTTEMPSYNVDVGRAIHFPDHVISYNIKMDQSGREFPQLTTDFPLSSSIPRTSTVAWESTAGFENIRPTEFPSKPKIVFSNGNTSKWGQMSQTILSPTKTVFKTRVPSGRSLSVQRSNGNVEAKSTVAIDNDILACQTMPWTSLGEGFMLSTNTLTWTAAQRCCEWNQMHLLYKFSLERLPEAVSSAEAAPIWVSKVTPLTSVTDDGPKYSLEYRNDSDCETLNFATVKTSIQDCYRKFHFVCQEYKYCHPKPEIEFSPAWNGGRELERISEENVLAIKAELSYITYGKPGPRLPENFNSYKYLQFARKIFTESCPSEFVPESVVKSVSRIFQYILAHNYDHYHSHRLKPIDPNRHERIMNSLLKCHENAKTFEFRTQSWREKCHEFCALNYELYESSNISVYCDCYEKIVQVKINDSYSIPTDDFKDLLASHGLNFELSRMDFIIEFIWKIILFTHFYCAQYFHPGYEDLSWMYLVMEELFDPDISLRWQNPTHRGNEIWNKFFLTQSLDSIAKAVDACVATGISISQYPGYLKRPFLLNERTI